MSIKNLFHHKFFWNIFDINAKISSNQALRYALSCTISICINAFICQFLSIETIFIFFFIFSALCSVYYAYGNTLLQQTLMITMGIIIIAILSFIGVFLAQYLWLAGLFLFLLCLIGYFYIPINMGMVFFVKLGIVILAFVVIGLPKHDIWYAWNIFWVQFFGGAIAILSNTIVYYLGARKNHKYYIKQWKYAFCDVLDLLQVDKSLDKNALDKKLAYLKEVNEFIKSHSFSDNVFVLKDKQKYTRLALIIDRISNSLILAIGQLKKNPYLKESLSDVFNDMLNGVKDSLMKEDTKFINLSYDLYRKNVLSKRQEKFFTNMDKNLRKSYAEFVYLFEKITVEVISLVELKIKYPVNKASYFKRTIALFNLSWEALKAQKIYVKGSGLTLNSKLALRGAIAITGSFLFSCFYGDPRYAPWIILSCNLVVLVRQGDTLKKGFDRISGHVVGFGIALILGWWVWPYFSTGYVWIPFLIFFSSYFFLANYFRYSVFLIIFIVYLYDAIYGSNFTNFPVLMTALTRLIDVSIGTAFAMLSSFLVFKNLGTGMFTRNDYNSSNLMVKHMQCLASMDKNELKSSYENINTNLLDYIQSSQAQIRSLSYQPERYKKQYYHRKEILELQIIIFGYISSLTRRLMYSATNLLKNNTKFNYFAITPKLENLCKEYMQYTTNNIALVIDKDWFPEFSGKTDLKPIKIKKSIVKTLDTLDQAILSAFDMSDKRQISYDVLINYVGICSVLIMINKSLKASI